MQTRRALLSALIGTGGAIAAEARAAQPPGGQQDRSNGGELQDRGAPRGRTGAATRGSSSPGCDLALDLVAPLRGVGLSSAGQPALYYLLRGKTDDPLRLTISAAGRARPLADFRFASGPTAGVGMVSLRDHHVRLAPGLLCVWSITLPVNPREPSQDMVSSALIKYRPRSRKNEAADADMPLERRVAGLARAGYWYDAVDLAGQARESDGGKAFASLLKEASLPSPVNPACGHG